MARAGVCYDIIVRRGGGAALWVNEADGVARGSAFAVVASGGRLRGGSANSEWGRGRAQTRAGEADTAYTRCKQRVAGELRCGRTSS